MSIIEDRKFMTQPLYVQLRQALTQRISSGVWKPGDALPNETEIAREFGLSPGTVRKALDWMEQANLVVRQQGRGTFVCDPSSDNLVLRYENIVGPAGTPVRGQPQLLSFATGESSGIEQERLRLKPGAMVHRIRQMRLADGRPLLVKDVVVSAAQFAQIDEGSYSISSAARDSGVLLGRAEERISIEMAGAPYSELLDVPEGTPLLRLDRIVFTIEGRPVEWRLSRCHLGDNVYLARTGAAN